MSGRCCMIVLIVLTTPLFAASADSPSKSDWWSLKPLVRPEVPKPKGHDAKWVRNPIDAFVLARLREKGLSPSPEADSRTLIRRLSFDLIGLPPTPDEVDQFIKDYAAKPEAAYEALVDRLLASPHYGERWARHWLDVVHYGDTHGYDKDKPRPNAWPYRDYVIRAFNDDRPYARFVQEQIAGDVLFPDTVDGIEALGFISAGPWDFIGHAEVPETKIDGKIARHLDRDDMVTNTMMTFASTTVQCAQCHNHKFDPIAQEDYYSLQAVFAAVDRADRTYYRDQAVAKRAAELQARKTQLLERKKFGDDRIAKVVPELAALAELTRQIAAIAEIEKEFAKLPPPSVVYSATIHTGSGTFVGTGAIGGKPRPIHVLKRGDVKQPLSEVGAGTISIQGLPSRFDLPADHKEGDRRAALAKWLTDEKNPLTWRSIVNRVWRYHIGRGIVESPNDFGKMGQLPTHPELLDWLAFTFREQGGSIKKLHKLIVTSATYRQSSKSNDAFAKIDAENAFYWRMNRRRLEAEAIRDSVLFVSGKLDAKLYGPAFQDFVIEKPEHSPHYEYRLHDPEDPKTHRRSIYRFLVRSQTQPFMTTLDCADPSLQVDKRNETLSALQALAMLNNGFMLAMAKHLAARVEKMEGNLDQQVKAAVRLALARHPSADELERLTAYAKKHGLANACRLILNLNEFVFVD